MYKREGFVINNQDEMFGFDERPYFLSFKKIVPKRMELNKIYYIYSTFITNMATPQTFYEGGGSS